MQAKKVHEAHGQRTFVIVLDSGDEIMQCLQKAAEREHLTAAQVTAIGAFKEATVRFWDWDTKDYVDIPVQEQVEVVSMNGDIAMGTEGNPQLHLHAVLSRKDGSTVGGHLKSGTARPTLEIIVTESPSHLQRRVDRESKLPLIALER